MGIIKVMFTDGRDYVTGKVISTVENSCWTHAAVYTKQGILEAIGEGVVLTPEEHYQHYHRIEIELEASDLQIQRLEDYATAVVGKKTRYDLKACVIGGLEKLMDLELSDDIQDDDTRLNCSENITRGLRYCYYQILPEQVADAVIPSELCEWISNMSEVVSTNEYNKQV